MLKARTTLNMKIDYVSYAIVNSEIRKQWETTLFDFEVYDMKPDFSHQKTYYAYKCPTLISDRDFVLESNLFWDFPEPEMLTCCVKSIKDDRLPERRGRVRANCHNMSFVLRPDKNINGTDITHAMLICCIDSSGMIPKSVMNYYA